MRKKSRGEKETIEQRNESIHALVSTEIIIISAVGYAARPQGHRLRINSMPHHHAKMGTKSLTLNDLIRDWKGFPGRQQRPEVRSTQSQSSSSSIDTGNLPLQKISSVGKNSGYESFFDLMMMDGAAMSDLDEDTAKSTSGSEEEEEFVMSGSKVVEEEEEEAPKEIVKVEEAAEAPRPVEGAETSSDVGIKRSVEEMEGGLKEAAPMPSPARPRLNINKSDKGQIGSHRNRDSKENRCKSGLSLSHMHLDIIHHSIYSHLSSFSSIFQLLISPPSLCALFCSAFVIF